MVGIIFCLFSNTSWSASKPDVALPQATVNKVDINSASIEELQSLKGIGAKYAERIIEYRTKHSGFHAKEEIVYIRGIGPKTYEKIKDKIKI